MKKLISLFILFIIICCLAVLKSTLAKNSIVIYTSMEDFAVELLQERIEEKFPNLNVTIITNSTSTIATKVLEEGPNSDIDIVFGLEYPYIEKIIDKNLAYNFNSRYDMTVFEDDFIKGKNKDYIIPTCREGVSIIVNNDVLKERGLPKPTSYLDLINPIYKNLLSIPSPASSGTGYAFYLAMVNLLGEKEALEYFDAFAKNVIQFTTSGSAPVNNLISKEAAIGIGMVSQAVEKISAGQKSLEIIIPKEKVTYGIYGSFILKGRESKKGVLDILDYIYESFTDECCAKFYPEAIFKDKQYKIDNFPEINGYCNMDNNTISRKEDLLRKWKY